MKHTLLAKRISILLTFGVFLTDTMTMAAAPILPDKNAPANRQPLVMETASGVPLVQITAPTAGGVSRNQYTDFNVPQKGAVLNNSYTMNQTQIAGWVQGNSNMAKGAAKIIVNEVTSARPTNMNGFLEVAGNKASVVIANPNGITVNGGGFINTNRAILTTGTPIYGNQGTLDAFDVRQGTVSIEGNGLEGRKAGSVALLARAVQVNAGLWADQLDIRTGANHIGAETYDAAAIEGAGEKPSFALDVSSVGGMYAGRIAMVGTEKGLGVNMAGTLSATKAVALDNNGNLKVSGTLYSAGNGSLKAANISNTGTVATGKDLRMTVENAIQNKNVMGAGISEEGKLTAAGTLAMNAKDITNTGHQLLAGEAFTIQADTLTNTYGGEIYSGGSFDAALGNTLFNDKGTINGAGSATIKAGQSITNTKGKLAAGQELSITADGMDNTDGEIGADQNGSLSISHAFTNTRGSITTGENASITAGETTLDGILAAGGDLTLTAGSSLSNEGSMDGYGVTKADGNVTITTEKDLTNAKKIEAGKMLSLTAHITTNKNKAELNGEDITIKTDTLTNEGLVSADKTSTITASSLYNREKGRIYGENITIDADKLDNRKNEALENQLETEMTSLRKIENDLEAAFAVDVTAFTSDSQKTTYFSKIKTLTGDYASQLAKVNAVKEEMDIHKSGAIAARDTLTIRGNTLLNRAGALLYSGGAMTLAEKESIANRSADIKAQGDLAINAPKTMNTNDEFSARRYWVDENGVQNENQIRIDEGGHPEHGQTFKESEFSELGSGYGAYHNKGITPKEPYDLAGYETITAPDLDDLEPGETFDQSLVGKKAPNYDYDDPIFEKLGVKSMDSPRPGYDDPKQAEWDAKYTKVLDALNVKIKEYNATVETYNNSIGAVESAKIKLYTIIRTRTYTSKEKVESTRAGVITNGRNMAITGDVTNTDSQITAGNALTLTGGSVDNSGSKKDQEATVTFGTTQESYTKKAHWPHKAWRRHYRSEIFMTPDKKLGNTTGLGVDEYKGNTSQKPGETDITQASRDNVVESLNPFLDPSTGKPTTTGGANAKDTMTLPDNAIYHVNDDSTSKYLVETDPAFTNKHNFLSSDYMYEQMKWDPDKVAKRLGDGFYEQDFIRQQITSLTGMRYLDGYGSEESEYKALMDAGVAYAKEQGLTPGIALTKEQVASLTSDIVWLETTTVHVNGKDVSVIYPHVYLRANGDMTLSKDGSLISGKSLIIDTKKEIKNAGSLYGNTVVAKGNAITNTGRIEGKTVDLSAIHDIHQKGLILGGSQASLSAGGNIDMGNTVEHGKNQDILDTTAGIAVKDKDGVLLMSAGKDLHLTGATLGNLGEKGSTILQAGGNVTMDTDKLTARKDMTENSDNYIRTYRSTETANTILGAGDITIGAGNNASLHNTSITSGEGKVTVSAGNDVSITNGETESRDEYGIKYKESGFLSSKTTTIKSDDYHKGVTGSLLSGNEVAIQSGKDTNITASTVVSQKDTSITAGGNVNIDEAQQIDKNQYEKQVKKSGLLGGGGLGFTIGSEKRKDTYAGRDTTQIGSTIGSVEGNVNISAHKEIDVKASDLVAGKDVNLTGENVNISSKDNIYHNEEKHEYKRSGLSVSVGGGVVSAVSGAVANIQRGAEVRDNQLKALYGVETYQTIAKNKDMLQDIKGKGMPSISVGIGSSSYASNSTAETTEARGSTVTAGNDVNITTKKDIQIHGSDVVGKDVTLKAGEDIKITAATQTSTNTTNQSSKSGSIGVTFSPTGNGIYANTSKGSGHENETIITHRGSTVAAGSMLTMESGKDTDIIGSKAGGNKVTVNAGGNLHVESERDKDIYTEKTASKGMGIGAGTSGQGAGSMGLSGGNTRRDTHSNYESVTSQAGIYAGNEGFDINVKGNTDLKGAVIDSNAPAEKNTLTTGTLTWEDMDNNADYKAGTSGTSYQAGSAGGKTTGGMTPVKTQDIKDKASSTTKSAISDGTVTITNQKDQKQDIGSLNRDTKDSLNKLAQIFDKEDVEERQELVNTFSQVMNEKIGDIAAEKGWAPNDPRRAGLHALAGGFTAAMGGGNALSGAAGAGVMESLQPVLDQFVKDHPDMREAASALIGSTVGKLTGDTNAGEAAAWSSTKFNWLNHKDVETYRDKINKASTTKEAEYYKNKMMVQDIIARDLYVEYEKEHPEYKITTESSASYLGVGADGVLDFDNGYRIPEFERIVIEQRSRELVNQKMGNTYEDYIGTGSSFSNTVTVVGTSLAANAPWTILSSTYKDMNVTGWGGRIGQFGIAGESTSIEYSWARDQSMYSGKDLYKAMFFDALGSTGSIVISGIGWTGGPLIKFGSIGMGAIFKYEINLLKESNTKTDQEKKNDKEVQELLKGERK